MKKLLPILMLGLIIWACKPKAIKDQSPKEPTDTVYDSLLVQKYGADQYGMKKYVVAFLKRGPNLSQDSIEAARLQRKHLENINRLAEEGKLLIAGPFMDDGELRGIYIFNVSTVEEARKLTETDPSIKAGRLIMELHPWYSSAAIMAIPELHKKLEQVNVAE